MANEIYAFVGHSFESQDKEVVDRFLKFFDKLHEIQPSFSWEHAQEAEAIEITEKVLRLFAGKNVFIAICTKKERAIADDRLTECLWPSNWRKAQDDHFEWKTSDWILQELGLAKGQRMNVIILLEKGVRPPGGLQGGIEYIEFARDNLEDAKNKLMEMVSKLAPRAAEPAAAAAPDGSDDEAGQKEADDDDDDGSLWNDPKPDWSRVLFEIAYTRAIRRGEFDNAENISKAYASSDDAKLEGRLVGWDAFREYVAVRQGADGAMERLQRIAASHPTKTDVLDQLASALAFFDEHEKSAAEFQRAAALASADDERMRLEGRAVLQLCAAGKSSEARTLLIKLRGAPFANPDLEIQYLGVVQEFSKKTEDAELELGALERTLELKPDDHDARFNLAFRHSEVGNHDLALENYLKIPVDARSRVTWNNIAVSLHQLSMPAKSVDAYRKGIEMGETLAMSNMANKYMQFGLMDEAKAELDEAIKQPDYHSNVNHSLVRLREIPDEENEKLKEVSEGCREKAEFYRQIGRAIAKPELGTIFGKWTGPDCVLAVGVRDGHFVAKGSYQNKNAFGLALGAVSELMSISYSGQVHGHAVFGNVERTAESKRPTSVLESLGLGNSPPFALVFSDDGQTARVIESPSTNFARTYTLTRIDSGTLPASEHALLPNTNPT